MLFALSIFIFFAYQVDKGGGYQFFQRTDWLQNVAFLGPHGIALTFGVDGIAAPMVLLTGIVAFGGALISWKIEHHNKDFFILFWVLVAGVYGTFESLDLFFFFFFYEVAVLPMYLLIAVWGSSSVFPTFARSKEYSAMKLTIMLVAASILIFLGIFAVFKEAGQGTFDLRTLYAYQFDEDFQKAVFPLFVIGCGVLAGLWPFHTWSPDGHVSAPTAVSMLHAGVLMKLGAFGIIRLGIQLLPAGASFWMPGLMVLATCNVVYGAFAATAQRDFKYMIGYSSVSHMGLVLMGLATMSVIGVNGAVLQMFAHGVMTALFFAMVGAVYDQAHTRDMRLFGGMVQQDAAVRVLLRRRGPRVPRPAGACRLRRRVQHLRRCVPHVSVGRRARHLRGDDDGRLHPPHVDVDVLRPVQRALGRAEGDDLPGARDGGDAARLHAVHGAVAGAVR